MKARKKRVDPIPEEFASYEEAAEFWDTHDTEDRACLVQVTELPGCMADGETIEEATRAAQTAIRMWIEAARKLGRPVPKPARTREAVADFFPAMAPA